MKKCYVCGSDKLLKTKIAHLIEMNNRFLIVKDVPAIRCEYCDEIYFENAVVTALERITGNITFELAVTTYNS